MTRTARPDDSAVADAPPPQPQPREQSSTSVRIRRPQIPAHDGILAADSTRGKGNSVSILETIDNAVRDYELSSDAMRWTPEAHRTPEQTKPAGDDVVRFVDQCGPRLTPWQREALRIAFNPVYVHIHALGRRSSRTWSSLMAALDALDLAKLNRRARISTMHRAYRHKTRNRW